MHAAKQAYFAPHDIVSREAKFGRLSILATCFHFFIDITRLRLACDAASRFRCSGTQARDIESDALSKWSVPMDFAHGICLRLDLLKDAVDGPRILPNLHKLA